MTKHRRREKHQNELSYFGALGESIETLHPTVLLRGDGGVLLPVRHILVQPKTNRRQAQKVGVAVVAKGFSKALNAPSQPRPYRSRVNTGDRHRRARPCPMRETCHSNGSA